MPAANLMTVTWNDIRKEVSKVNPDLAAAIDNINPSDKYKLLKVCYPFGSNILNFSELQLPNAAGKIVSRQDASINNNIKEQLAYTLNMPIGVVLNNVLEMQWQRKNNTIPWFVMHPGRIFGLWGLLQTPNTAAQIVRTWRISAGCRSLFILPKISDALAYTRLKKEFNLSTRMPSSLLDQWDLLKELTESSLFNSPWQVELLFFTAPWYQKIRDGSWEKLEHYLLKSAWQETAFLRDECVFNFVFSTALAEKNLKPNPFLTDTVKHIYAIARKCLPAFTVAINDLAAPIKRLEQIFDTVYQHKFAPTFMHLSYFNPNDAFAPIYYSLEMPTLIDFSPKSRKNSNKITDLYEIKHIQTAIGRFIQENKSLYENTPIYDYVSKISFDYYHSDIGKLNELKTSSSLSSLDAGMIKSQQTYDKPICTSSPFLRGCIRIGTRDTNKLS